MNETINNILKRRSARGFKPDQIDDESLNAIIKCGLYAPSGMNSQDWHFTVVQNQDLLSRMNQEVKKVLPDSVKQRMILRNNGNSDYCLFYNAPTVIFMSGNPISCALAGENMCLAATSLGIDSCFIGLISMLFDEPKSQSFIDELGIPKDYAIPFAIVLGYKNMTMPVPERLANKVNYVK